MIEPKPSSLREFPPSSAWAEGIQTLPADFTNYSCAALTQVEYACKGGIPLHLQLLVPRPAEEGAAPRFPLIVYVQGSAWLRQDILAEFAQLAQMARRGFVVAIVEYRPSYVSPFPAQVKDVKTAVRFLRRHAEEYRIDPDRAAIWGDSSGAHTAVMTAFTQDCPELDDEYAPDLNLRAAVDYYGPTDISRMNEEPSTMDHRAPESPEGKLLGGVLVPDHPELVAPTVPMNYLSGRKVPPLIIFHGDRDRLVPFHQSVLLYEAMKKSGGEVSLYKLEGADHAGPPFWSPQVLDIVERFLREHLK